MNDLCIISEKVRAVAMNEEGNLPEHHAEPASETTPWHGSDIEMKAHDEDEGCEKTNAHIDHGAHECDFKVAGTTEESLNRVCESGCPVHKGNEAEIFFSFMNDIRVRRKQKYGPGRDEIEKKSGDETIAEIEKCASAKALSDTTLVVSTPVLCQHGGHSIGNRAGRNQGKIIDAVCGSEGSSCRHAERVYDALNAEDTELDGRLLDRGDRAVLECLLQHLCVEYEPCFTHIENRDVFTDVVDAECAGHGFRRDGSNRSTGNPEAEHHDEQEIPDNVYTCADREENERRFAIAECLHRGREIIIEEGENEAERDDTKVAGSHRADGEIHLQKTENRVRKYEDDETKT